MGNGCYGGAFIQERLDRAIVNGEWRIRFPQATLKHLPSTLSNHAMILLDTVGEHSSGVHQFRFESFWTRDLGSFDVVKNAWTFSSNGSPAFALVN